MNQQTHSKTALYLIELMINILFFSVLITICLQFLLKAQTLASTSTTMYRASNTCASIAEIYQSGIDGKKSLLDVYPDALLLDENLLIYFDESFTGCPENKCCYRAFIHFTNDKLQTMDITLFEDISSNEIYHLQVAGYRPHSLLELTGGTYE